MTTYVVLRYDEIPDSKSWYEVTRTTAASAEAAVRNAVESIPKDGLYVAIPARSFKPVSVQAVQTTTIKLGEAT